MTEYKTDPAWLNWCALVDFTLAATADSFVIPQSVVKLDDKYIDWLEKFNNVPEFQGCMKPKDMMAANYAPDIIETGPLIRSLTCLEPLVPAACSSLPCLDIYTAACARTWCMTFEALYQIVKKIAENSNHKNFLFRLADIWQLRSGLDLLDQTASRWNEFTVTLQADPVVVHYSLDHRIIPLEGNKDATMHHHLFFQQVMNHAPAV